MERIRTAHSPMGESRSVVVIVGNDTTVNQQRGPQLYPDDKATTVTLAALLPRLVEEFGSEPFGYSELRAVLEEFVDEEVTRRSARYVAGQLVDPEQVGGAQLGTTPDWELRLGTATRDQYSEN